MSNEIEEVNRIIAFNFKATCIFFSWMISGCSTQYQYSDIEKDSSEIAKLALQAINYEKNSSLVVDNKHELATKSVDVALDEKIRWTYPEDKLKKEKEITDDKISEKKESTCKAERENLNFSYKVKQKKSLIWGNKLSWMPIRIFDDGKKTFIQFSMNIKPEELPALFVESDKSHSEYKNYHTKNNCYIINRVFKKALLKKGINEKTVIIENKTFKS